MPCSRPGHFSSSISEISSSPIGGVWFSDRVNNWSGVVPNSRLNPHSVKTSSVRPSDLIEIEEKIFYQAFKGPWGSLSIPCPIWACPILEESLFVVVALGGRRTKRLRTVPSPRALGDLNTFAVPGEVSSMHQASTGGCD